MTLHSYDSVLIAHDDINSKKDKEENSILRKELSLPQGKSLKSVSCGRNHIIALATDWTVFSYGLTSLGQCGMTDAHSGKPYIGGGVMEAIDNDFETSEVSCGLDHTLFLERNGQVFACGWAADGQTGTGVSTFTGSPSPVIGDINKHSVRRVYAGANTSFAITESGLVYAWGNNEYGQLGVKTKEPQVCQPQPVNTSSVNGPVKHIAAGDTFTYFVTECGHVFTCGYSEGLTHTVPSSAHLQEQPNIIGQHNNNKTSHSPTVKTGLHYCLAGTPQGHYCMSIISSLQLKLALPPDTLSICAGPDAVFAISR